jgi:sn-glycerol 3-phosphate transport system substrate-binding protein
MKNTASLGNRLITALGVLLLSATASLAQKTEITFFYPISASGPIAQIITGMVNGFEAKNPDVKVTTVYSGTFLETLAKSMTAARAGNPPTVVELLSVDLYNLIDEDLIEPWDGLIKTDDDKKWLADFFPALMRNSQDGGKTYGIPFQRSTQIFYWNKDAFAKAGLDPDKGPQNWTEMVDFAKKLTLRDAQGNVTQWGVQIPSSLTAYWLLQSLVAQSGGSLGRDDGKGLTLLTPEVKDSLQFWADLALKDKVMKPGVIEWGTTPRDFMEGKTAMLVTTTGNLTNFRNNAPFRFGVAMLPANKQRGTPTGGGNIYLFKGANDKQKEAALRLMRYLTSPELAADWAIKTGYIAVSRSAWQTEALKKYVAEFPPAATARDQLEFAVREVSTYEWPRIQRSLDDNIAAVLTGSKTVPQALADAQATADKILAARR